MDINKILRPFILAIALVQVILIGIKALHVPIPWPVVFAPVAIPLIMAASVVASGVLVFVLTPKAPVEQPPTED